MDTIFKAACFAMVGAILAVTVKKSEQSAAMLLSVAVVLGLMGAALSAIAPVLAFASELRQLTGLSDPVTAPLFKTVAIAVVSHIASSICQDAGEGSVARAIELCGSLLALYAVLPLMSAVLELIEDLL